jgi:hypothetical protein
MLFDNATVVLEMRRSGKFYAKASGWETTGPFSRGPKIEIWVDKGRWLIGRAARAVEKAPAVPLSEDNFQTA